MLANILIISRKRKIKKKILSIVIITAICNLTADIAQFLIQRNDLLKFETTWYDLCKILIQQPKAKTQFLPVFYYGTAD